MAKRIDDHVFSETLGRRPLITALEQRILLDATAPVTAAKSLGDADTDNDQDQATQQAEINEVNALAPTERERKEVAFVDGGLDDVQTLIDGISENGTHIEIVTVDPDDDGFAFMAEYLEGAEGIDAIHVLGHGDQATATLGTATLDANSIDTYANDLQQIGQSLTEAGDLLLYGCYVGAGADGEAFVEDIAALTSADVAASDDLTGAASLGGDWELESTVGDVTGIIIAAGYKETLSGKPFKGSFAFYSITEDKLDSAKADGVGISTPTPYDGTSTSKVAADITPWDPIRAGAQEGGPGPSTISSQDAGFFFDSKYPAFDVPWTADDRAASTNFAPSLDQGTFLGGYRENFGSLYAVSGSTVVEMGSNVGVQPGSWSFFVHLSNSELNNLSLNNYYYWGFAEDKAPDDPSVNNRPTQHFIALRVDPPPNTAPTARNPSFTITEDETRQVSLNELGSDVDNNLASASISSVSAPSSFQDLDLGDTRTHSISYSVSDDQNESASGTVTLTVTGLNDAPEASDSTVDTIDGTNPLEEDFTSLTLQRSDFPFSDVDGDDNALDSIRIKTLPDATTEGVLKLDGTELMESDAPSGGFSITGNKLDNGQLTFEAVENFNGEVRFDFTVLDDGGAESGQATLTIDVAPINDAPVLDAAGGSNFAAITENDVNNAGSSVSDLIGDSVTDADVDEAAVNNSPLGPDNGSALGIAIFGKTVEGPGFGGWQYWLAPADFDADTFDSTTLTDADWTDLGTVSESNAFLLGPNDRLRFKPDEQRGNGGESSDSSYVTQSNASASNAAAQQVPNPTDPSSLKYYAWDGSGTDGNGNHLQPGDSANVQDANRDGGSGDSTAAFSADFDEPEIAVTDINDAPSLEGLSGDRHQVLFDDEPNKATDVTNETYGLTDSQLIDQDQDVSGGAASLSDADKLNDVSGGLVEVDYAGYQVEITRNRALFDANITVGDSTDEFGFDFSALSGYSVSGTSGEAAHPSVGSTISFDDGSGSSVIAEVLENAGGNFRLEFRNTGNGVDGSVQRATQAVVDDVLRSITYRADKPYGDADFTVTVSDIPYPYSTDGDASTMDSSATDVVDFGVDSIHIFVTQTTEADSVSAIMNDTEATTASIDSSDGISLREAVIIAERQGGERVIHLSGTHSITNDLLIDDVTTGLDAITLQLDGDTTLEVADGKTLQIDANVTGIGNLTKTGTGDLVLNGDNDFGGTDATTTLSAGTLSAHAEALQGDKSGHGIDVAEGTTLTIVQGSDSNTSGVIDDGNGTLAASLSGKGRVIKDGDDTLTLNSSDASHEGVFEVAHGIARVQGGNAIGDATTVEIAGGAELAVDSSEVIGSLKSVNTTESNNALLTIEQSSADSDSVPSETLTIAGTSSTTFTGRITGEGSLVKKGTTTLTLDNFGTDTTSDAPPNETSDESDYTGDTVIEAGTLVATGHSIGDLSAVTVHGGATFRITGDEEIGSLASQNSSGTGTPPNPVTEAVVEIDSGDEDDVPGSNEPTLTTGGNDSDTTFAGEISGEGGLTKTGSGGMVLDTGDQDPADSGDGNTFSGPLTVEEGDVTTEGGASVADGTEVIVNAPGRLNVDDSEEIGSLNGNGEVNIGGDTEIGQGLTARLEARLRPQVEDAVNAGDVIEYTLTLDNTSAAAIDIDALGIVQNGAGASLEFKNGSSAVTAVSVGTGAGVNKTLTAQYTLTAADISGGGTIDLDVTLSPDGNGSDNIDPPIVLSESTSLTPNDPTNVLTVGGNANAPVGSGGTFTGSTSGPGGLRVDADASGGLTVGNGGDLGHDGGTVIGNGGTLTNTPNGTISGEGDITVEGGAAGTDPATPGGSFINQGTLTDGDDDTSTNDGLGGDVVVLGPNGVFNNAGGSTEGDVTNNGTTTNSGTIGGDVINQGEDADFTNKNGGTVEGSVDNDGGTVTNQNGGTIRGNVATDGGTVSNAGDILGNVSVDGGGSFDNTDKGVIGDSSGGGNVEVNDGTFNNDGSVSGDVTYIPPSGSVTGKGTVGGTIKPEEFIVELHGTVDRSVAGAADTVDVGDTIHYRLTVTNKTIDEITFDAENIDLSGAKIYDPSSDGLVAFSTEDRVSAGDGNGGFSEGETWIYAKTVTLDASVFAENGLAADGSGDGDGDIDQTVTVSADDGTNSFSGTGTEATPVVRTPRLTVNESGTLIDVDGNGEANAGDRIDYVTTITNTGNVAVKVGEGDFSVSDDVSNLLGPTSNFADSDNVLDAGEVWTYTYSYQLSGEDVSGGKAITGGVSVTGSETGVNGGDAVTATASSSVELVVPPAPEDGSVVGPDTADSRTAQLTMGGLVMEPDGVNRFDIAGISAGATEDNGGYDQLVITSGDGEVRLGSQTRGPALQVNLIDGSNGDDAPFIPARGDVFVLIDNNANNPIVNQFTYAESNDRGNTTVDTDNDVAINDQGDTRTPVEEGDILRFDGYDFRISYIGDTDGDGSGGDNGLGDNDVTLTRVNMYPEVLADTGDRYSDGAKARPHSYPDSDLIDGKALAADDRRGQSAERDFTADSDGLVTIDNTAEGHATSIDLAARNTHSDFEVIAEAGEDNQGTLATGDIENLPFKVSGTLGLYDPDAVDGFTLVGAADDGSALASGAENGVTAVKVEHYASTAKANADDPADRLTPDPRQPDQATLRGLFTAEITEELANELILGDFNGGDQPANTATLTWTFDASGEAAAAFDYLDKNEVMDITYTIRVTDGQKVTWDIARDSAEETDAYTEHAITVRVIGTNDPVKVLVDDNGSLPNVDHLWQFGRDYTDNVGRELNVYGISLEGREHATPTSDADRIYDISRLFVDRDVTEDLDNDVDAAQAGLKENIFFSITSTKPSTGEVIQGPAPEDLFKKDENDAPIYGQLAAAYQGGTTEGMLPGLILDHDTGEITGRPTDIGTYIIEVTAIDSSGATATRSFELLIVAPPQAVPQADPRPALPQGLSASVEVPTVERRGLPSGNVGIGDADAPATDGQGALSSSAPPAEPAQPAGTAAPADSTARASAVRVQVTASGEVRFADGSQGSDANPSRALEVVEARATTDSLIIRVDDALATGSETYSVTLPDGSPAPSGVVFDPVNGELRVDRAVQGLAGQVRITVRYADGSTQSIDIELGDGEALEETQEEAPAATDSEPAATDAATAADPAFTGFMQQLQAEAGSSDKRVSNLGAALEAL